MEGWKLIGQSRTGIDLEMQKALLWERAEIRAVVMNKKLSAYDLGNWELYVHQDDEEEALNILKA
ncbi:hypothetical protein [Aquirufa echingensis]|jgi:hypothetical protein|uniref:DUF2007 domain-containing protein n=1 Tax=Aquirufa echingensis TaxID=3096516 RepID=A0ABW6CX31_9BACT